MVDDDAVVLEMVAEQMRLAGFQVCPVPSALTALGLLDAGETFDLMITDLSMPGMDGMALIQEAQRRRPGLPAILLTGYATNAAEIATGGAMSGAFSLLRKPIDGAALAERASLLIAERSATCRPRLGTAAEPARA